MSTPILYRQILVMYVVLQRPCHFNHKRNSKHNQLRQKRGSIYEYTLYATNLRVNTVINTY